MAENSSFEKPWVVLVGGFLGAGKTTLLLAAAKELKARGLRSAIILNDQSEGLVDTEYTALHGFQHGEVTGGCFCCRFSNLIRVMETLRAYSPDVIFAEPVGSCTDISATTLQPLREYSETYRLAPFTVLVDPERASELLRDSTDANLKFLFQKQMQEADILCITKSDISQTYPAISDHRARQISAKTGQGVAAWLDEVLSGELSAGSRILDIDYEQYARAEAALAWLNLQVRFQPEEPLSPAMILGPLLDQLDSRFTANGITVVHLKAIISSPTGFIRAAICANGQLPTLEGALDASPASRHDLLLNLRALGSATQVREIVEQNLKDINICLTNVQITSFHPAAPRPERCIAKIR